MENKERHPDATDSEKEINNEVTLNYIDKLYDALGKNLATTNRAYLVLVIVSLVLMILAAGFVSTGDTFSLLGFELQVSPLVFLASGIVILSVLIAIMGCLSLRDTHLREEIARLYGTIGFYEAQGNLDSGLNSPLQGGYLPETLVAPLETARRKNWFVEGNDFLVATVGILFFVAVPIVAQITALVRIATQVGWQQFRIWGPLAIIVGITVGAVLVATVDGRW